MKFTNMFKRIYIVISLIVSAYLTVFAQNNTKAFYPLDPGKEKGRPTFSIIRTDDGFIWFAKDNGVCRYDGKSLKTFTLPINWKGHLLKTSDHTLYCISTEGYCFRFDEKDNRFNLDFFLQNGIPLNTKNMTQVSQKLLQNVNKQLVAEVSSVDIDKWDRIWIASDRGVKSFDTKTSKWFYLKLPSRLVVYHLLIHDNCLYLFSKQSISYINLSDNQQKCTLHYLKTNLTINDFVNSSLYEPGTGNLYWGTMNKGLYVLTPKGETKRLIGISNSPIRAIKQFDKNTLLVGFDGLGIYEMDIFSEKVTAINNVNENNPNTLGSNGVYDMLVDSDKRIWVATYTNGINIYDPNMINFDQILHQKNTINSLYNNTVNAVFQDYLGNDWFGTNNGLSVRKAGTNEWKHFITNSEIGISNNVVLTIADDADGNVWAGGFGFGLLKIDPKTYQTTKLNLYNMSNEMVSNFVFSIHRDNDLLWIGGMNNALCSIDPKLLKLEKCPFNNVRIIVEEDKNHLFLINGNDFLSYNKLSKTSSSSVNSMIKNHPKIKNATFFCAKREGDNVWIGTSESGLILYSIKRNTLEVFNTNDGLPSNCILSVEIDNNNCLWIATDEGLCYFNPVTKVAITFITDNNSENGIFSYMGSTKRKDGTMIFATKQGAISFDPLKMFILPNRGKLAWTDLVIHNNTSNTRDLSNILDLPLNKSEEIDLSYNENSFSFYFQELNYSRNINTRYAHQLVGFDKELSQLTNDGIASYYNLPPGKYRLEVRSYFADKEGNYEHRSIEIRVRQPWYNTFWAWCLWSLLIFTSAYFTYRYFKRRLERRYSEEKIRFFINVSHDMRTPITLIKAPLGDLLQNESLTPAVRYLANMINNNVNRLFEMINRVLEFEQSDENEMVMNLQEMEVNQSVIEIIENFSSYAETKNINLQTALSNEPIEIIFDKKKLEMIMDNLVTNAIKYSYQGGEILVKTGFAEKEWWIEVEDNGIGIPMSEQKNIFKRFFRAENAINSKQIGSGLGLLLVNNLTKFLDGNITFQSEEGVRTIFKISFPLNNHSEIKSTAILSLDSPFMNSVNEIPSVLYVDDNDDLREYINSRLGTEYRVFIAASAQEGLKILAENQINLVITDIMMPEINGFELCEKIKSNIRYSVIPVILLSALSDKKDIIKGLQIGADDYITKPFDSVFLKQRIDNLLENRKRLKTYFQNTETINTWEINEQSFVNELDKLFIEKLERSIDANMSNPKFTIDTLSRDLGMSRTILYYRMKNLMNVVPNDYLRLRKLEKAAEFLKNPKYTIYDVAEMVGYSDEKYFKSVFTKHFGYSPRKKPL